MTTIVSFGVFTLLVWCQEWDLARKNVQLTLKVLTHNMWRGGENDEGPANPGSPGKRPLKQGCW